MQLNIFLSGSMLKHSILCNLVEQAADFILPMKSDKQQFFKVNVYILVCLNLQHTDVQSYCLVQNRNKSY